MSATVSFPEKHTCKFVAGAAAFAAQPSKGRSCVGERSRKTGLELGLWSSPRFPTSAGKLQSAVSADATPLRLQRLLHH